MYVYVPADGLPASNSDSVGVYCPCVRESKRKVIDYTDNKHALLVACMNSLRHLPALLTMMDAAPVAASEVCPT